MASTITRTIFTNVTTRTTIWDLLMSCPPVGHWPRKGPNRKVQNYFTIKEVLLILLITSGFGVSFRFDPRQEVQIKPLVRAGGFISSLAKLTMRLASEWSFTEIQDSGFSYLQTPYLRWALMLGTRAHWFYLILNMASIIRMTILTNVRTRTTIWALLISCPSVGHGPREGSNRKRITISKYK